MANLVVDAVYENGVLRLSGPLPLRENDRVRVTVEPALSWADRTAGLLQWTGDPEALRQLVEDPEFGLQEAP